MTTELQECVAYLTANAIPITTPRGCRNSAEQLSQRLADRGVIYTPETLIEAVAILGWPTKVQSGRIALGVGFPRPLSIEHMRAAAKNPVGGLRK